MILVKKKKMFLAPFWCSPLGCNRTMVLNWGRQQPGLHGHRHLHVQFTEFSSCSQAQHYTLAPQQLRVKKLTSCFELTAKCKHTKKNLCVQGLCRWSHSDPWIASLMDIDTFCLSFLLHWIGTCYTGLKQLKSKRSHTNIPPDLGTLASSGQITRSWRCSAQYRDCYTLPPSGRSNRLCTRIVHDSSASASALPSPLEWRRCVSTTPVTHAPLLSDLHKRKGGDPRGDPPSSKSTHAKANRMPKPFTCQRVNLLLWYPLLAFHPGFGILF